MQERVVVLPKAVWVGLMEALLPEERFIKPAQEQPAEGFVQGLVVYVLAPESPDGSKLLLLTHER